MWEVALRRNKRTNGIAIAQIESLLDMKKAAAGGLSFPRQIMSRVSAIGPKQTSAPALHMSAFGGKADMALDGQNVRFREERHHPLLRRAVQIS